MKGKTFSKYLTSTIATLSTIAITSQANAGTGCRVQIPQELAPLPENTRNYQPLTFSDESISWGEGTKTFTWDDATYNYMNEVMADKDKEFNQSLSNKNRKQNYKTSTKTEKTISTKEEKIGFWERFYNQGGIFIEEQMSTFPQNPNVDGNSKDSFRYSAMNFQNAFDNFFYNGADVLCEDENSKKVVYLDDIHTFSDGLIGRNMRDLEGRLKGSKIKVLGPTAVYTQRLFEGLGNSATRFGGEMGAGALNLSKGTLEGIFVDLPNAVFGKNPLTRGIDYTFTETFNALHIANTTAFEHAPGGIESQKFFKSLWNAIKGKGWQVNYSPENPKNRREVSKEFNTLNIKIGAEKDGEKTKSLNDKKDGIKNLVAGSEIVEKEDTLFRRWSRGILAISEKALTGYFIGSNISSSESANQQSQELTETIIDWGTGGPVGK